MEEKILKLLNLLVKENGNFEKNYLYLKKFNILMFKKIPYFADGFWIIYFGKINNYGRCWKIDFTNNKIFDHYHHSIEFDISKEILELIYNELYDTYKHVMLTQFIFDELSRKEKSFNCQTKIKIDKILDQK